MSQVDLSKIKEIIEEDNITSVNYRLDNGWQLLAISSAITFGDFLSAFANLKQGNA